jgi:hypothetical protein
MIVLVVGIGVIIDWLIGVYLVGMHGMLITGRAF